MKGKIKKENQPVVELPDQPITWSYLVNLHFDIDNPRFGPDAKKFENEIEVLDYIVETFGVEDVLSSLAVNGYYESEPLVGVRKNKGEEDIHILEGNRRLAACLILARDPRAKNQKKRQDHYGVINAKHGHRRINPVPVIVFEGPNASKKLLPYLGVRHIVGSTDWDSYSKAAWVANVVKSKELSLDDIMQMIGDDSHQSERLLAAYYFVSQLVDTGRFDPKNSLRKGRGSNAAFPFSLVYNALGYAPIWKWVGFSDSMSALVENPIPKEKLDNAEWLMTFICGDSAKDKPPSIRDSREISDLAKAIADPEQVLALKRGKSVAEAVVEALPAKERLVDDLGEIRAKLQGLIGVLGRGPLTTSEATELIPLSRDVRKLAAKLDDEIFKAAKGDDSEE